MARKKIEKISNYCRNCRARALVNPEDKNSPQRGLNKPGFCSYGYTQNPRTETKTFNVAINNGIFSVCFFNPWRKKSLIRMGLADSYDSTLVPLRGI